MKVLISIGTRPEIIKLAPVVAALKEAPELETRVVFSGQHRELLDQMADFFGIVPNVNLHVMDHDQGLADTAARILSGMTKAIAEEKPDFVLVQGDTTTVFATALAAFYAKVPVGHVEAGLRSGDRFRPYPEEVNRRLVAPLADLHFAPTQSAKQNLVDEGILDEAIHVTGNTSIDAVLATAAQDIPLPFDLPAHRHLVSVTLHRREAFGAGLGEVLLALKHVAQARSDVLFVYPLHPNPAIRQTAKDVLGGCSGVLLIDPLPYGPFVSLLKRSRLILTDSGGLQEEAPALNVPVLVAREVTERPEGISAGVAALVGLDRERIRASIDSLLNDDGRHAQMAQALNPYGDGHAAERIVRAIEAYLPLRQ